MTSEETAVRLVVKIERTMSAPPKEVYRAWLDPEMVAQWMTPGRFRVAKAEIEPRVGGRYRVWHSEGEAPAGGFEAEVLELVPETRLAFRWGFVGPDRDRGPVFDSHLTVTLRPGPDQTTFLTLVHESLDALAAGMPEAAAKVEYGWRSVIAQLDEFLQ